MDTIDQKAFEQEGRKIDAILTEDEIDFLKNNITSIKHKDEFSENFDLEPVLQQCKMAKSINQVGEIIGWNSETVALLQVYLFAEDIANGTKKMSEIDGILGRKTFEALTKNASLTWQFYSQDTTPLAGPENNLEQLPTEYTLSEADFKEYFEGDDFQQQNVWNCRLISAVDSLTHYGEYEKLIRTSVTKTPDGFTFTMPLWSPKGKWKKIEVTKEDLGDQISIRWTGLSLLEGKEGIKSLMVAYGKIATGKDKFDLMNLEGWWSHKAFNTLVYNMNIYIELKGWESTDEEFGKKLKSVLEWFNARNDVLVVNIRQGDRYDELLKYWEKDWGNHAVSVEKTYINNWQLFVVLSNPHDSNRSYSVSFDSLMQSCRGFDLGTHREIVELTAETSTDEGMRTYAAIQIKNITTLNQIIQKTGWLDKNLSLSRGDVIVKHVDWKTFVESRWKKDTYIVATWAKDITSPNMVHITVGNNMLSLSKNKFSNIFNETEDDNYQSHLYPPRLTVLINKMRHDYIDKKMRNSSNKNPFSIDKEWRLVFDDAIRLDRNRVVANLLLNTKLKILEDWDSLWIDKNDIETKQKIAGFLNSFCS